MLEAKREKKSQECLKNRIKLLRLREEITEKGKEKGNEMWRKMVKKIDKEKDPKQFWKELEK